MNQLPFRVILASASPRRIEIFKKHGIEAVVMPTDIDETLPEHIKPQDAVMFLALKKAMAVEELLLSEQGASLNGFSDKSRPDFAEKNDAVLIVAADTVVAYEDRILGKPEDEKDAFKMLSELRGNSHSVYTGAAAIGINLGIRDVFYDRTQVNFKDYTDDDILNYIATKEPMDKAGAYAIQGGFGKYVESYIGSYENIVGFPWERFENIIIKL